MAGEVHTGTCRAEIANDPACGNDKGTDQATCAVADVFVLTFFRFTWCDQNGGMLAFEDLHAGLFVAADDQFAVLIQNRSCKVQFADFQSFAVEIGIMAIEPVNAAVRLQVGLAARCGRWWSETWLRQRGDSRPVICCASRAGTSLSSVRHSSMPLACIMACGCR